MSKPEQVVMFMIDGLRPDALQAGATPVIDSLIARGSFSFQAQTVYPSTTLTCHTSLIYSVGPELHAVRSGDCLVAGDWRRPHVAVPSLYEVAHRAGLGTAVFSSWEWLADVLGGPGTVDESAYIPPTETEKHRVLEIASAAARYSAQGRPGLSFLYLGAVDAAGHRHGWMSKQYTEALSKSDRAVGIVLESLEHSGGLGKNACLILADHGGQDSDHGTETKEDMTIPWIIVGAGVCQGHQIGGDVSIMDSAPTLLRLLGLRTPDGWGGSVIDEVLA